MLSRRILLFLAFLGHALDNALGQVACVGDVVGDPNPVGRGNTAVTSAAHQSFLVAGGVDFDINCLGVISQWTFYSDDSNGACHEITFQVWRPVDPALHTYTLVGENSMNDLLGGHPCSTTPCCTAQQLAIPVPLAWQIQVLPGDVIGWTDSNSGSGLGIERLMSYDDALPGSNAYDSVHILTSGCTPTLGAVCSWDSSSALFTVRGYSLNAILDPAQDPIYENMPAAVTIKENEPVGIHVFTVVARDPMAGNAVASPLSYSITDIQPAVPAALAAFEINEDTGKVTTFIELDYEDVLIVVNPAVYTVTVSVAGTSLIPVMADLNVTVEDVNDQHTINNLPATVDVDCSATGLPAFVFNVTCIDPDYVGGNPAFLNHSYYLMDTQPNSDLFEVTPGGVVQTKIDLTTWFGEEDVYKLKIGVGDGEFFSGPLDLYLNVHSVHRAPVLANLPNTAVVAEDMAAGFVFGPLLAWNDSNGMPVTFEYITEYPHTWIPKFQLQNGPSFNEVHILNPGFNYLVTREHQVEITVKDSLGVYAVSAANLTVEVLWVNQPPLFDPANYTSTMPEREPVGTVVPDVLLEATDRDIPLGDWLDFTLHGPDSHLFTVSNVTNLVYVAGDTKVDPNTAEKTYNLLVDVYDSQGVNDTANLSITITDINDHAPVFNPTEYNGTVAENAPAGYSILTVYCTDDDWGENAALTYTIPDPVADIYYEVANNADLLVKQPINHHEYPTLSFEVVATDRGVPPLSGTATVHLAITPVNNHEPVFTPDFYNVDLKSDVEAGHVALTLTVTDPDHDDVNTISFFFFVPDSYFFIGQTSGDISVERVVNHYRKYILYPMVTDKGSLEYYSDPATVRIDTYNPPKHLVNLHLMMPMVHFESKKDDFILQLNNVLAPFVVFCDQYVTDSDRTVVTVYAWRDNTAATIHDLGRTKHFAHRDDLLPRLRNNIQGHPKDVLRGPEFAEYQVVKVLPTHPVWIVDTVEGIVTLSLLCLLFVVLLVALLVYICRRNSWGCFKKNKVAPSPPPRTISKPVYNEGNFVLKYASDPKLKTASSTVIAPAAGNTNRASMWDTDKDKEPLPPAAEPW